MKWVKLESKNSGSTRVIIDPDSHDEPMDFRDTIRAYIQKGFILIHIKYGTKTSEALLQKI